MSLADWTRVHSTDLCEVWMHRDGYISRRTHDPWSGRWAWTSQGALPRCDEDGNSSVQLGPRVVPLARAHDAQARPLPRRLLLLETALHARRTHHLEKLHGDVQYQVGTLLL